MERRFAIAAVLLTALLGCGDSTPPNDFEVPGRYALAAVDGKALPGLVYATRSADGLAYDTMWVVADTLELREDLRARETGVFLFHGKAAEETVPRVIPFTLTTGGTHRDHDGGLIVTTWLQVEDTVARVSGGARLVRPTYANVALTRSKPVFTYVRLRE